MLFFKKNKVFFQSFNGKSYSDNPKAVFEQLLSTNQQLKYVWSFENPQNFKKLKIKGVSLTRVNSLKYFYHLATSSVWVDNFEKMPFLYKNKKQFYIQTYHGDRSFKKVLNDSNARNYMFEENKCDLITTGSLFGENMMKTAMKYNGQFLKFGSPRNDVLLENSDEKKKLIKRALNIREDTKIILYAPTYRETKNNTDLSIRNVFPLEDVANILEKQTQCKWCILIRTHPNRTTALKGELPANVIDVTFYEDMSELLLVSDFLITDYSSSATDFILTNRPVVLYQYDKNEYMHSERDFYYDIESTGFLIAYDKPQLLKTIKKSLLEDSKERNNKIKEFYGVYETGKASIRLCEEIQTFIKNK